MVQQSARLQMQTSQPNNLPVDSKQAQLHALLSACHVKRFELSFGKKQQLQHAVVASSRSYSLFAQISLGSTSTQLSVCPANSSAVVASP